MVAEHEDQADSFGNLNRVDSHYCSIRLQWFQVLMNPRTHEEFGGVPTAVIYSAVLLIIIFGYTPPCGIIPILRLCIVCIRESFLY